MRFYLLLSTKWSGTFSNQLFINSTFWLPWLLRYYSQIFDKQTKPNTPEQKPNRLLKLTKFYFGSWFQRVRSNSEVKVRQKEAKEMLSELFFSFFCQVLSRPTAYVWCYLTSGWSYLPQLILSASVHADPERCLTHFLGYSKSYHIDNES